MSTQRTVLCPTDFSPCSKDAFQVAAELARSRAAHLVVLHVVPVPLKTLGGTQGVPAGTEEIALKEREAQLAALKAPEGVPMETRLEVGDAVETILRIARETGSELIALGTHGRTGVRRILLGSVAEQVLRRATCPVLTVRGAEPIPV
jgi:nucleotide-binding universal stress UspA family protein